MGNQVSRIDVVGQNGNDGLHYLEDAGDEQQHVDKRTEPVDQRPATAHYWSPGASGYVSGWYKIAHDGKWWFWRAKDGRDWLHAPRPKQAIINTLVALPPLDTATHVTGSYYFRLGQHGWECWKSGSKQWIGCMAPNPGSVDRVIHPGLKPNPPEVPGSSDHIPDAGKMIEGDSVALEAKRQQLKQDHLGDVTKMVTGIKHDGDKPRFDLIPPLAERAMAEVLTFGAAKYSPDNWRKVEDAIERYTAAALRHINARRSCEYLDPESQKPHMAHAMCCIAYVLELEEEARSERGYQPDNGATS